MNATLRCATGAVCAQANLQDHADDKENARLIISGIVVDTFKSLQMRYPETDKTRRLVAIRQRLTSEDPSAASGKGAGLPEAQP